MTWQDIRELPLLAIKNQNSDVLNARLSNELLNWSETEADAVSHMPDQRSFFENKWLSKLGLHKSKNTDLQCLVAFIEQIANRSIQQPDPRRDLRIKHMWSMVSRSGLVGKRHDHASIVSGVYYVDAGSSGIEDGGMPQFFHNRNNDDATHEVQPKGGLLYLFPGSLEHAVSTYTGARPRIVISVNLDFDSTY